PRALELAQHIAEYPQASLRAERAAALATFGLGLDEGLLLKRRWAGMWSVIRRCGRSWPASLPATGLSRPVRKDDWLLPRGAERSSMGAKITDHFFNVETEHLLSPLVHASPKTA